VHHITVRHSSKKRPRAFYRARVMFVSIIVVSLLLMYFIDNKCFILHHNSFDLTIIKITYLKDEGRFKKLLQIYFNFMCKSWISTDGTESRFKNLFNKIHVLDPYILWNKMVLLIGFLISFCSFLCTMTKVT
jgi:hypothetical protein